MVQTRSMSASHQNIVTHQEAEPQKYHDKYQYQTSRGNEISNNAPYGALNRLRVHNYRRRRRYTYVPPPITLDEEQNEEINLSAVIVGLNNRITEMRDEYYVLYKLYLTEYNKRKKYEIILRKNKIIF